MGSVRRVTASHSCGFVSHCKFSPVECDGGFFMEETKKCKTDWASWTLITLLIVLLVYPVSLGPVIYLARKTRSEPDMLWRTVEFVYTPSLYAIEASPENVSRPAEAYLRWWADLATP